MSNDSLDLELGSTIRGFAPGQKVFGRFTLVKILGRGGMGVVWLAQDEELEREVALKFLPEILSLDRESVAELKKETRRNLDLTHSNIVRIYDFVQDARAAAISMEYINGTSLSAAKVDREGGVFKLDEVRHWMTQICEALSYAHEKARVVHRDLKPANLMVDSQRQLKITDFGIACSITDSISRVSKNIGSSGTPIYMSPQQMLGEKPAPSDDIYSLGATLFEMLSGKPPFYTGNIILQVQSKVPQTVQQRREELGFVGESLPPEWETVIASCLAKDAAQRPASVSAIAAALNLSGTFTAPVAVSINDQSAPSNSPAAKNSNKPAKEPNLDPVRETLTTAQRRNRKLMIVGGVILTVLVVGWIGDVPNRYKADQSQKAGQVALLSSDWRTALIALRQSATLRPTDIAYRAAFDEAQKQWLDMLQREIKDKAPRVAYDVVMARASMTGLFIDPHAETFARLIATTTDTAKSSVLAALDESRKLAEDHRYADAYAAIAAVNSHASLVADFSSREQAVKVAEVQHGISLALESMNEEDFKKAYTLLDGVKTNAALVPDYEVALRRIREVEVRHGMSLAVDATDSKDFARAYEQLAMVKEFASLVPEYEAALQTVRESEVRHEIGLALALAGQADFAAAYAALEKTAGRAVLPDEVVAGKGRVRALAETYNVDLLGKAIVAGNAAAADAIIADYARFTDSTFTATSRDLVGQRDLEKFLTALETLRIRPAAGQKRTGWLDVILVTAARTGFEDTKVRTFIAESYLAWSRRLAEDGFPALALYLHERARQEGAAADEKWEKSTVSRLPALASLAIKVDEVRVQGGATDSLQSPPVRALLRNLGGIYGSWASSAEAETVLTLNLSLGSPKAEIDKSVENKSVVYQSGTRQVDNNAYAQRRAEVDEAIDKSNAAQQRFEDAKRKGDSDARTADANTALAMAVSNSIIITTAQYAAQKASNDLQSARRDLAATPRTLTEAVYDKEPYKVITHRVAYSLNLRSQPATTNGKPVGEAEIWRTGFTHETIEIVGDARHGVPVREPQFPTASAIAAKLNDQLAKEVSRTNGIASKLANASIDLIKARAVERKLNEAETTEQLWGAALLWGMSGVNPGASLEIERRVRRSLGFAQ